MNTQTKVKRILVSGSIAYDRIMDFPGVFAEHILPEEIHQLNVSFPIPKLVEKFGGTAGNIAYSLSLLGLRPVILAQAGNDFRRYRTWLKQHFLPLTGIQVSKRYPTAAAYIMTDRHDNQISGFYLGAMVEKYKSARLTWHEETLAIIAPDTTVKMMQHARDYRLHGVRYILDPGQQMTALTARQLMYMLRGAYILISNDYELQLMLKRLGTDITGLKRMVPVLITTFGDKGSKILVEDKAYKVCAIPPKKVIDPTGAGDAYRAGLLYGLIRGYDWKRIGLTAAAVASFAVAQYGTQEHSFSKDRIERLVNMYL